MLNRISPNVILWLALATPIAVGAFLKILASRGNSLVCEFVEREMGCQAYAWVTTVINSTYFLAAAVVLLTLFHFPLEAIKKNGWVAAVIFILWFILFIWASNNLCHEC